jgi:hypothetical protein
MRSKWRKGSVRSPCLCGAERQLPTIGSLSRRGRGLVYEVVTEAMKEPQGVFASLEKCGFSSKAEVRAG